MTIRVMLNNDAYMPEKAHDVDAGFDIRTPKLTIVPAHSNAIINSGVHMEIPRGYVGMVKSKSGLNVKHDLTAEGVVDSGYTGNIFVKLYNHGDRDYTFEKGDKITQVVILPIPDVELELTDHFEETERGNNGFGSSGR